MRPARSSAAEPADERAPFWPRAIKTGVGLAVTLGLLGLIVSRIDVMAVTASVRSISWACLTLATALLIGGYGAKIARWHVMISAIAPKVPVAISATTLLASVALNNVLPLRAGDVARVFAFRDEIGASASAILPLMLLERLLDTAMLVMLTAGVAIPMQRAGILPAQLGFIPIVSTLALIGLIGLISSAGPIAAFVLQRGDQGLAWVPLSLRPAFGEALGVIATQFRGRQAVALVALTTLAWGCEGGMLAALAWGFGLKDPMLAGYFACALATLATLIPSAPGFFGTFHAAAIGAVSLFGATPEAAAAFAFLAHGLLWLPLTACGLGCLAWLSAAKLRQSATGTS